MTRDKLDDYAIEDAPQADPTIDPVPLRSDIAPKAFAALRAVLDLLDDYEAARAKGVEIAMVRDRIERALS